MHPAREIQPRSADDLQVLKVALRPSAIADGDVDERGRSLLPRAAAIGRHAHLPSPAAYQRSLDEIMREHVPAERLAALELGKSAALGEGLHADDGIVSPVIAAVAGPRREAARDHRTVRAGGELLQPGEERARPDEARGG